MTVLNPHNSSSLAAFDGTGLPVGARTVDSIPRDARIKDLLVILIIALHSRRLSSGIVALRTSAYPLEVPLAYPVVAMTTRPGTTPLG
jgi:hypothetical protein